jgi:glycosyltransferase involved in cell wall biosynthesis
MLYLVTEGWFFASHFIPMARTAHKLGFDVTIATQLGDKGNVFADEGFRPIELSSNRGSSGLIEALRSTIHTYRIVRQEKPDVVHCIALRSVVLGGLAAKLAGARYLVLAPTGLGHLWTSDGIVIRALRKVVRHVVGSWLNGPDTRYLFENHDDPGEFGLDLNGSNIFIVGGAGVVPDDFPYVPEPPAPPVKLAVVSRMIAPKGIAEAVKAVQQARAAGSNVELDLYGEPDLANPLSISSDVLREWSRQPGIRWHGRTETAARVWREHHIALFLSTYREGLPRSIVESAAAGRPIIACSIPGCRDLIRDGHNGILVAPGDTAAAARAIAKLAADAPLRQMMGRNSHLRVLEGFTENGVTGVVARLYQSFSLRTVPRGVP